MKEESLRFSIPSSKGDLPLEIDRGETRTIATCTTPRCGPFHQLYPPAKTASQVALSFARAVFKSRLLFDLVGASRLQSMVDTRARLDALSLLPSPVEDDLVAWRVRARALGCHVPSTQSLDAWRSELDARIDVVARYVDRSAAAGRLGRPGVKYRVVLADPPWSFQDKGTRLAPEYEGEQRRVKQYDTLPLPEILALGEQVQAASADDALLFLWVPAALVAQDYHGKVSRAWGFEPKTLFPWIKTKSDGEGLRIGGGHYTRTVSEELVVATRGDYEARLEDDGQRLVICSRGRGSSLVMDKSVPAIIRAPRQEHSRKPPEQYDLIERLVGMEASRIELFARTERDGWDSWGDEG